MNMRREEGVRAPGHGAEAAAQIDVYFFFAISNERLLSARIIDVIGAGV
jgi:hypothetical protein